MSPVVVNELEVVPAPAADLHPAPPTAPSAPDAAQVQAALERAADRRSSRVLRLHAD